ncbi:MAG: hypothetical protein DRO08_00235 [Thermoprotei archaeon]|nr:MAG: hypothetical protein DRN04_17550 [Thermoprotei archaeon]RLG74215.1 MAG: hypothetical protein DRO08_00235 [Thermoprotei archaeon]
MPVVSSGVIRLKYAVDKIKRSLLVEGVNPEAVREAGDVLDALVKDKMLELKLSDEDVAEVEIAYSLEENKVVWDKESLKITVYKPLAELEALIKEKVEEEAKKISAEVSELRSKIERVKRELSEIINRLSELEKSL